jgi:predicted CoA-binding protein
MQGGCKHMLSSTRRPRVGDDARSCTLCPQSPSRARRRRARRLGSGPGPGANVMTHPNPSDAELRELLANAKTVAMVGASAAPERPSHGIMQKLLRAGYDVIPVNPNETEVLGKRAFASLSEVPVAVDIVNVFRRAEHTPELADQAVAIGAKALWLQQGIVNEVAAQRARAGGLMVVMDSCIGVMHSLLRVPPKVPA